MLELTRGDSFAAVLMITRGTEIPPRFRCGSPEVPHLSDRERGRGYDGSVLPVREHSRSASNKPP
jgi:hypothetical protein